MRLCLIFFHKCADGDVLQLDHAVVAVGFGWEDGVGYFVIRNSWTGEWGEGGYIRIKAGGNPAAGKCGKMVQEHMRWTFAHARLHFVIPTSSIAAGGQTYR